MSDGQSLASTETMTGARERLLKCFATVFPELAVDEIERASTASVASWDSLATVTLISVVEEEFQITIPAEEFEDMVSFALVLEKCGE